MQVFLARSGRMRFIALDLPTNSRYSLKASSSPSVSGQVEKGAVPAADA